MSYTPISKRTCNPFLSVSKAFFSPSKKLWLSEKKAFNIKDFRLRHPKPKDLLYLSNHRGINKATLETFITHIQLVKAKNKPTTDIGFPYHVPGKNEIVGFELVNYLFKGHAKGSNKSEGLWVADLSGTGFPPNVFIAESAIDAMSFYQLYKQKFQLDQAALISTGGYVTDRQLRNVIQNYSSSQIHTIFDNDISGHLYDIRTACMKSNKDLRIHKDQNEFNFRLNNSSFSLPKDKVSLTNFRKESGLRSYIRVHKAKAKDFNEMVMERAKQQLNRAMKRR